ncbi:MAG TPA: hypothetical protein VL400_06240 [Polyangiaceae bacterium]|nr:hypothetical protein [Polyangiaceae bacterium]
MTARSGSRARSLSAVAFAAATLWTGALAAQPKSDTAAEAVFQEGIAKLDRGDYAGACPLLERAVALSTTEALGGMLTLAECLEHIDKPASAWGLYKRVAARARVSNEPARIDAADKAAARLEPTLPRVKFKATSTPSGLSVRHGDEAFPAEVWDVPLPVDPGQATFTFGAPGYASRTVTVDIPKGAGVTEVVAPDLSAAASAPPHASQRGAETRPAASPASDGASGGLGALGIAGIVVAATGVVATVASAGVMADAKGKWSDAVAADCGGDLSRCRTLAGIDDARSQGDVATAVFGVGLGVAAVGAALFVVDVARGSSPPPKAAGIPRIDATAALDPSRGAAAGYVRLGWSY